MAVARYTFQSLSDVDFEELCRDLLQKRLRVHLQPFPPGKDGGIDLLGSFKGFDGVVIQCKHYLKSGLRALTRALKKEELPKLRALRPQRYVLCTSIPLTKKNKTELVGILHPYCHGTEDIYGQAGLNGLLRDNPAIERSHHKLWLTGVPMLEAILRHGAAIWNNMEKEEIEHALSLYVQTPAFAIAMAVLKKHHFVILSGIPGIGKTTLARVLASYYMKINYSLIAARSNVQEILDLLKPDQKQVVTYDDFLGRSGLAEKLDKNEDHGLVQLIKQAARSKSTRVILTTREYILREAQEQYEPLRVESLSLAKCILSLEGYTRSHRARILYNHLYFSRLPRGLVRAIVNTGTHRAIVDHPNYSPRVIEWMTTQQSFAKVNPSEYPVQFIRSLDNPDEIWSTAFSRHMSSDARAVLYVLASMGGEVKLKCLQAAWRSYLRLQEELASECVHRFERAVNTLDGSFIAAHRLDGTEVVSFHNASIGDFVGRKISLNPTIRQQLAERAAYWEQVQTLAFLDSDGKPGQKPSGDLRWRPKLVATITRVITKETPRIVRDRSRGGASFNEPWWTLGSRFTALTRFVVSLGTPALQSLLSVYRTVCLQPKGIPSFYATDFLGMVRLMINAGIPDKEITDHIFKVIRKRMTVDAGVGEWKTWGRFVNEYGEQLGLNDRSALRETAKAFLESAISDLQTSTDSSDQMEFERGGLEDVADEWGVDIEADMGRVEERIEEVRNEESVAPTSDDPPVASSRTTGLASTREVSDMEIDLLFARFADTK